MTKLPSVLYNPGFVNFIELCAADDERVNYFLDQAKSQGYNVLKHRGKYLVPIVTDFVWKGPKSEFKSIANGLYVFEE